MNLPGGRRSADEGEDDYWPFGQGANPADAPAPPPSSPPQPPPRRPAGESVLPQVEQRVTGDRRRQGARRPGRSRVGGALSSRHAADAGLLLLAVLVAVLVVLAVTG